MTENFIFNSVGQGLFYSGRIDNFNFLYDCGSSEEDKQFLTKSVLRYKRDTSRVNMLILSHLHYDHTAGLNLLFKDIEVGTVVLPYLTPQERLLISLVRLDRPRWFYNFLSDPISFLIEKGIKQVVLIGGRGGRQPETRPSYTPSDDDEADIQELRDDNDLIEVVKDNDPQLRDRLGKELLVKNHDGYVKALGKWFFRFFNYNVPTAQFTSFKQCIDAQLGAHFDLTQIIKSGSLSKLKGCYRKIQKSSNFNDTSLMVYHAPIKPSSRKGIVQFDCPVPYCNFLKLATPLVCTFSFAVNYSSVPGQFLTGDINLNTNLTEIEKHYQPFFPEVSVVQVPHHGAWRNWNKGILRNFHDNIIFVASAGTRNRFNHPDPNVVSDIQKSHDFLWCNELAGIHIYYV